MITIKETKIVVRYIYIDNQKDWKYYMVQIEKNTKDEITKISEYVSQDLKNWILVGKPYTYIYLKNEGYPKMTLEQVYNYMYNKYLSKLDIYDIVDSIEVKYLGG